MATTHGGQINHEGKHDNSIFRPYTKSWIYKPSRASNPPCSLHTHPFILPRSSTGCDRANDHRTRVIVLRSTLNYNSFVSGDLFLLIAPINFHFLCVAFVLAPSCFSLIWVRRQTRAVAIAGWIAIKPFIE